MWKYAEYSVEPKEVDEKSSSKYVYVRRDIKKIEKQNENEESHTIWTCEEQKVLKEDWEFYKKIYGHDTQLLEVQDALIELASMIV